MNKLKFRCYKNYLVRSADKISKKIVKIRNYFRSESKAKFRKIQSTFNSATKKSGKMESSSSSPETPEILRDVSHQENLEEQCQELLKSSENREGKYFLRNNCILISNFFFFLRISTYLTCFLCIYNYLEEQCQDLLKSSESKEVLDKS